MDWDEEYDNEYDDMAHDSHRNSSLQDKGAEGGIDPIDIANPACAHFLLSDDTQDEITGSGKMRMKCLSCGHLFMGEFYGSCPECFSSDTEEETDEKGHGYW
jgi:hypothetical protein